MNYIIEVEKCVVCESTQRSLRFRKNNLLLKTEALIFDCQSCGLTYSGSSLSEEGAAFFYENTHQHGNFSVYGKFSSLKISHFKDRLEQAGRILGRKPGKYLDLGCGEGQALEAAAELGWETCGIEISESAIKKARAKGIKQVTLGSLEKLNEFGFRAFDIITLFDVLDHARRPKEILIDIKSCLSRDGILYLDVCDINSFYAKVMRRYNPHLRPFEHLTYFNRDTLKNTLEKCGYEVVEISASKRQISIEFFFMTLQATYPSWLLSAFLNTFIKVIPRRLSTFSLNFPIGVLSATARLAS